MEPNRFEAFCSSLDNALQRRPPGEPFQQVLAPVPRRLYEPPAVEAPRHGGVLVLAYPASTGICLPLTRRSEALHHHGGQISLPGGAWEPSDASFVATALREAREELGIDTELVRLLGELTPLHIPVSGYEVHPFVGCYPRRPDFVPDPFEVAELIEACLETLLDPATRAEEFRERDGQRQFVPYYRIGAHKIWGATAMILSEFLNVVKGMQW